MKINEFINTYINKKVDFDKVYGAQCVDLFRQYCKDVLNIPHTGAVEGAKDLYLKYNELSMEQKYFTRLEVPCMLELGDVVIWNKTDSNSYGHVAILVSKSDEGLLVFEQNGFKQDGAKLILRTEKNVLGILRRRRS